MINLKPPTVTSQRLIKLNPNNYVRYSIGHSAQDRSISTHTVITYSRIHTYSNVQNTHSHVSIISSGQTEENNIKANMQVYFHVLQKST
jgi:hypothetical protein